MNVDAGSGNSSSDPLGYAGDLTEALHDAALEPFRIPSTLEDAPAQSRAAALRLAVAIGRCRLFDVEAGEMDGLLPANAATAAAAELAVVLERERDDAISFPRRFDDADPFEAEDLCEGVLEQRMSAWAAFVAIEEAYEDAEDSADPNLAALQSAIEDALTSLERFDDLLTQDEFLSLLSVATASRLLDNWRAMLAPPHRDPLPWWLDGTLEEVARRTAELLESTAVITAVKEGKSVRPWFAVAAVAAAAPAAGESPFLGWTSPDGGAAAILTRTAGSPDDLAVIEFSDQNAKPLVELAGRSVRLGDLNSIVDASGGAPFRAGDLSDLASRRPIPPDLLVGDEGAVWKFSP